MRNFFKRLFLSNEDEAKNHVSSFNEQQEKEEDVEYNPAYESLYGDIYSNLFKNNELSVYSDRFIFHKKLLLFLKKFIPDL